MGRLGRAANGDRLAPAGVHAIQEWSGEDQLEP